MDRGEKIAKIILVVCFILFMWVMVFQTKQNNDRFDKMEKELLRIHYELKTK